MTLGFGLITAGVILAISGWTKTPIAQVLIGQVGSGNVFDGLSGAAGAKGENPLTNGPLTAVAKDVKGQIPYMVPGKSKPRTSPLPGGIGAKPEKEIIYPKPANGSIVR
jgi:hypothetical protein